MTSTELSNTEYAPYYGTYILMANDVNMIEELEICLHDFIKFVQNKNKKSI